MSGAVQTPLWELLRGVPIDTRLEIQEGPFHTHYIPVGRHCHEAAKILEAHAIKQRLSEPPLNQINNPGGNPLARQGQWEPTPADRQGFEPFSYTERS